jgi:hypothetical protein
MTLENFSEARSKLLLQSGNQAGIQLLLAGPQPRREKKWSAIEFFSPLQNKSSTSHLEESKTGNIRHRG